ncbi:HK97 family phage prohead protease [Hyphobacterium sp.]|uniref:HK97 family phage prohead protease n=1 Tax=Hyphobacterium sp. TaxID=2004662 RepID=UPI003BACA527
MTETGVVAEPLRIEGYASLFGLADLNKDIVRRGAFARGLQRRGIKGVRMLFQHDAGEPVGVWDEIREDSEGLFVSGRVLMAGPRGRATAELIRQGAVDGLSIGFRTERFAPRSGGGRELQHIDLWEVSIVTFPMLPQARLRVAAPAAVAA